MPDERRKDTDTRSFVDKVVAHFAAQPDRVCALMNLFAAGLNWATANRILGDHHGHAVD